MSVFLYCFREREEILHIIEAVSGQRMMTSYLPHRRFGARAAAGLAEASGEDYQDAFHRALTNMKPC